MEKRLASGGSVLMPLDAYPFSQRYGWVQDKYGIPWQLILTNPDGEMRPGIIPALMFTRDQSSAGLRRRSSSTAPCSRTPSGARWSTIPRAWSRPKKGSDVADFFVGNTWLAAMDGAGSTTSPSTRLSRYLSPAVLERKSTITGQAQPESQAEQCSSWKRIRFGLSWQVWPTAMGDMMSKGTPEQLARVTKAFMSMKKFDLATLQQAYEGR